MNRPLWLTFLHAVSVIAIWLTTACAPAGQIRLQSISPAPGTTVTADSTIVAIIEFRVKQPASSQLFAMMMLSTREGTTRTLHWPPSVTKDPRLQLADTAGVIKIRYPLALEWGAADATLPLKFWIYLNAPTGQATSTPIQMVGPITYHVSRKEWLESHGKQ